MKTEQSPIPDFAAPTPEYAAGFSEQLIASWQKLHPEALKRTYQAQEQRQKEVAKIEEHILDLEMGELCREYGIDGRNIKPVGDTSYFSVPVTNHFGGKRLPAGYEYKGGAARALLLRSLNLDPNAEPRDLDIVRVETEEPQKGMDEQVAREFMEEDFQYGHGVEILGELDEYFDSRDFTQNEILASDTEILITRQGLLDNIRRIIRLTESEKSEYNARYKLLPKMLRFYSEAIERYDEADMELDGYKYETNFISPFYIALQLDKAYSRGQQYAESFTAELIKRKLLPAEITDAAAATAHLTKQLTNRHFYFRHAPSKDFLREQQWAEQYEE